MHVLMMARRCQEKRFKSIFSQISKWRLYLQMLLCPKIMCITNIEVGGDFDLFIYLPTICNIEVVSLICFQEYKFHWAQYFQNAKKLSQYIIMF